MFLRGLLGSAVLLLALPAWSDPPSDSELDDLFATKVMVFVQEDGGDDRGGNPYIDEDAAIYEALILVRKRVGAGAAMTGKFLGEVVSAASYDDARDRAETVSGATGYNPGRFDIELGWQQRLGAVLASLHGSFGQEYAYRAYGYGGSLSGSLAEGASQLFLGFQGYSDLVRVLRFDGTQEPDGERDSYTLNGSWTQSLTPTSLIKWDTSYTWQSGFLATAFNSVRVAGVQTAEQVPDNRNRLAMSARYKLSLGQDVLQPGASWYRDTWGIDALTLEIRYLRRFSERLAIEPVYRFYSQSGAGFYSNDFAVARSDMSADPDLGDFDGHSLGTRVLFGQRSFFGRASQYDVGLNLYRRSDDLNFLWLTFGVQVP